ncbi:unnamed protein product, partial [marine sediment metagenome]
TSDHIGYMTYSLNDAYNNDGNIGWIGTTGYDFDAWRTVDIIAKNVSETQLSSNVYTLVTGENSPNFISFDGSNIWLSLYVSPGKIVKMDPADPTNYITFNLSTGDNQPTSICSGGGYIWSGLYTAAPHRIMKMFPNNGTYSTYSLGTSNPGRITFANGSLWVCHDQLTTILTKMDPSDGSYTQYTITGHHDCSGIVSDGEWLWMTGNNPPHGLLAKFHMGNNSYTVYGLTNSNAVSIWFDGSYLWIPTWQTPSTLVRYIRENNTYSTFVTFPLGFNNAYHITSDNSTRIWVPFSVSPGRIARVFTTNQTIHTEIYSAGENNA